MPTLRPETAGRTKRPSQDFHALPQRGTRALAGMPKRPRPNSHHPQGRADPLPGADRERRAGIDLHRARHLAHHVRFPARTRNRRPGRTRKLEPVARRSRKAVSTSSTATTLPKKHPQPKLTAHAKTAGRTKRSGTRPRSAWSTTGALPRNSGRRPRNSANAGTAASPRSSAKRVAPGALRATGSPAGAAMPNAGERPNSPASRPAAPRHSSRHGYAL